MSPHALSPAAAIKTSPKNIMKQIHTKVFLKETAREFKNCSLEEISERLLSTREWIIGDVQSFMQAMDLTFEASIGGGR